MEVQLNPIAVPPSVAKGMIGVGRSRLFELIADGSLKSVKLGRKRLILVSSLRALVGEDEARS